jgi:hypothetical protein
VARNYRKEYDEYHKSEEQKKRRAQRNKARKRAIKRGSVRKGDSKEVHHLGNNRKGRLGKKVRVVSRKKNRSEQPKRDGSQD